MWIKNIYDIYKYNYILYIIILEQEILGKIFGKKIFFFFLDSIFILIDWPYLSVNFINNVCWN